MKNNKSTRTGVYYRIDCMNHIVSGLYPAREFDGDQDAEAHAANYEATLTKLTFDNGRMISSVVIYDPREY